MSTDVANKAESTCGTSSPSRSRAMRRDDASIWRCMPEAHSCHEQRRFSLQSLRRRHARLPEIARILEPSLFGKPRFVTRRSMAGLDRRYFPRWKSDLQQNQPFSRPRHSSATDRDRYWFKCWISHAEENDHVVPYLFVETFIAGETKTYFDELIKAWCVDGFGEDDMANLTEENPSDGERAVRRYRFRHTGVSRSIELVSNLRSQHSISTSRAFAIIP